MIIHTRQMQDLVDIGRRATKAIANRLAREDTTGQVARLTAEVATLHKAKDDAAARHTATLVEVVAGARGALQACLALAACR